VDRDCGPDDGERLENDDRGPLVGAWPADGAPHRSRLGWSRRPHGGDIQQGGDASCFSLRFLRRHSRPHGRGRRPASSEALGDARLARGPLLELVRLLRQRREAGLEEVVQAG
jgi:hypothetical protein